MVTNVSKGSVHVGTSKDKSTGTDINVGHKGVGVNVNGQHGNTQVSIGGGGVHVNTPKGTTVNVGHGGVNVNTRHNGKPPVAVNVGSFIYRYAASDTQIRDNPQVTLFFLEKDLHPGAKMKLHFTKAALTATFIPQNEADSLPFSSIKLPEILNHFGIDPKSSEAETLKKTLKECEMPAINGESKYCATSLESMVKFSIESLSTSDINVVSTTVGKGAMQEQEYTINEYGLERMNGNKLVACHLEEYKYAVFYCHTTRRSRAYTVKMVAENGENIETVAICHTDTAAWNPKHVAFRVLGVKPGTVPVCHFLPQNHVVWGPRN